MSVELFYPDNRNRAKRVQQLIDNIVSIQSSIAEDSNRMDEEDKQLRTTLNDVLTKNGYKSYDQLRNKVFENFTEEEKNEVTQTLADFDKLNAGIKEAFDITMLATFGLGTTALAANTVSVLRSGSLYVQTRVTYKAFARLAAGKFDEAVELFKAASKASKAMKTSFETGTKIGKVARGLRIFGEVVSVVGLVTDGILAIIAAIEGAKQRDELKKKIVELFESRLATKMVELLAKDSSYYQQSLKSIVRTMASDWPEKRKKQSIESFGQWLIEDIEKLWSQHTYDNVCDLLSQNDKNANAWTNEDPGRKETIAKMESVEDILAGDSN